MRCNLLRLRYRYSSLVTDSVTNNLIIIKLYCLEGHYSQWMGIFDQDEFLFPSPRRYKSMSESFRPTYLPLLLQQLLGEMGQNVDTIAFDTLEMSCGAQRNPRRIPKLVQANLLPAVTTHCTEKGEEKLTKETPCIIYHLCVCFFARLAVSSPSCENLCPSVIATLFGELSRFKRKYALRGSRKRRRVLSL